ncbi:MAG: NRDE family protein [Pseudomonadota bacterium]
MANRDEFHDRPAAAMAWWRDREVLAGRDLQAGGTWLALDRAGRVAAVTNYREWPPSEGELSRGVLPLAALELGDAALEARIATEGDRHAGFNLLLTDRNACLTLSNREPIVRRPATGVHAVSNGALDADWPKTQRSRALLEATIARGAIAEADLLEIAMNDAPAPDEDLPDTGIGEEMERFLSPCFIRGDRYGTRAVTLIWVGSQIRVVEHRFGPDGTATGRSEFNFLPAGG